MFLTRHSAPIAESKSSVRHRTRFTLRSSQGFTLLEIVVAVGIFAVIAAIIFPALVQFLDTRERIDAKHKQVIGLQKTFLFMSNDLRFAANRLPKDEYGELAKTTLKLNDDSLMDFTANYPDLNIAGLSVPRRVIWQVNEGLLQRIQYPVMDPDGDTRTIVQNLLPGVVDVEVEISYVEDGRDNQGDKWEEQSRLPGLIEITVELEKNLTFNRILTMQGGDSAAALLASANSSSVQGATGATNTPGDENDPATGDP